MFRLYSRSAGSGAGNFTYARVYESGHVSFNLPERSVEFRVLIESLLTDGTLWSA